MNDKDILILYTEDYELLLNTWLEEIRSVWNPESQGARSWERSLEILEKWEGQGRKPDLVIFDRGILEYEDDTEEDDDVGNDLYRHLISLDLPIAVFSSNQARLKNEEPYCSDPPALGFYEKTHMERDLRIAVEKFKKLTGKVMS